MPVTPAVWGSSSAQKMSTDEYVYAYTGPPGVVSHCTWAASCDKVNWSGNPTSSMNPLRLVYMLAPWKGVPSSPKKVKSPGLNSSEHAWLVRSSGHRLAT
jgi:hypothetical protein